MQAMKYKAKTCRRCGERFVTSTGARHCNDANCQHHGKINERRRGSHITPTSSGGWEKLNENGSHVRKVFKDSAEDPGVWEDKQDAAE